MKLVFLGRYRDMAGAGLQPPANIRDLAALRIWLEHSQPGLAQALAKGCAVAVNQMIVRNPSHPIADNDEIAFLPPMSGG